MIEKSNRGEDNPEKSSTTKEVGEHISSGFSVSTISSCKTTENKYDVHRGEKFEDKYAKDKKYCKI